MDSLKKLKPFALTLLIVVSVGILKTILNHVFQVDSPMLLFVSAVTVGAWYGGLVQGLFATFLTLVAMLLFFYGNSHDPVYIVSFRLGLYVIECFAVTLVCDRMRATERRMARAYDELKNAEGSRASSEGRLSRVFESNMIGLIFSNFQSQILDANDYFLNLVGATRDELRQGKLTWKQFTPPEYDEASERALQALRDRSYFSPFEKEYVRRDGSRVTVLVGATRVEENMVVAYILDMTQQKNAEKALTDANNRLEVSVDLRTKELTDTNKELTRLVREREVAMERVRESESFLDLVIENIPNMIFVKDAKDLKFVRFNKAGETLVGRDRGELIGKNDYDFFPRTQAEFFVEKDRAVLASRHTVEIPEEPIMTATGLRFLYTKKLPLFDKHGEPQYLLGISEDITEKKVAEQQRMELLQVQTARNEAEKTARRLAFLSDASGTLNESLEIEAMLNSFASVVLRGFADWCVVDFFDEKDRSVKNVVCMYEDPDDPEQRQVPCHQYYDAGAQLNFNAENGLGPVLLSGQARLYRTYTPSLLEDTFLAKDIAEKIAKQGPRSLVIAPLIYHGKVFGALTLISKKYYPAYTDLDLSVALDLAKRASLAIENAKLYQRAEVANQAKSAFLANMSHEIRTPLGAMLGFAELMAENKNLDSEQNAYLSTIVKNGKSLLRLVDEVLDLSKVESDRIQIEQIAFSLPKLLDEVIALLRIKAEEKGLNLRVKTSDLPTTVTSDPTRLRQILINIIGNAIKFTERGSVDVDVSLTPGQDGKAKLRAAISDTGIGITPEQASHLFEPFMQADDSMTRKFGGTGLGLFLSRKLARLLGGDVVLEESFFSRGSRFVITVVVEVGSRAVKEEAQEAAPAPVAKPAHRGRVLVVDDAPDNQVLTKAFLHKLGLDSDVADNGQQGVDKALSQDYDVVLMDIQMPEMDGFAAVQALREKNYHGTVVALTAHAMKGDRERCLENGFDDYLCKPITRKSLQEVLAKYLPIEESAPKV